MSREKFQPGMLVFLPQSMMSYSDIWVIARVWDDEQTGRRRCVCHRIDRDKGVPMTCPDPRCEGKGNTYNRLERHFLELADKAGMTPADYDLKIWKSYARN